MTDVLGLIVSALVGVALGGFFFGGLWWTVRRGLTSEWPATLFVGSVLVRTAVTLGGIWAVSDGQWPRIVASLVGFTLARLLVSQLTRTCSSPPRVEVHRAPKP